MTGTAEKEWNRVGPMGGTLPAGTLSKLLKVTHGIVESLHNLESLYMNGLYFP